MALEEIRLSPSAQFVNTAAPNGADQVNGGIVQANPLTTANNVTADNLTYQCTAGTPLSTAISNQIVTAPSTLSSSVTSPIIQTVTPYTDQQINEAIAATSPVSTSISEQADSLLRIQ